MKIVLAVLIGLVAITSASQAQFQPCVYPKCSGVR